MKNIWRGAVVVMFLALLVTAGAWKVERDRRYTEHINALNKLAEADRTTREVRREGDSAVAVARRQVRQVEVQLDGALRERNLIAHSLAQLRIEANSLSVAFAGLRPEASGDTLKAASTLDARDSIGVLARVAVQLTRDTSQWQWSLTRSPAELTAALGCKGDTAVARVRGPTYLTVTLTSVEQSAEVCNPRPTWQPFSFRPPSLTVAVVLLGLGVWLGGR